jgi:hypothetical protein
MRQNSNQTYAALFSFLFSFSAARFSFFNFRSSLRFSASSPVPPSLKQNGAFHKTITYIYHSTNDLS